MYRQRCMLVSFLNQILQEEAPRADNKKSTKKQPLKPTTRRNPSRQAKRAIKY